MKVPPSRAAERRRPHVLYVTNVFGYPPRGGPRLRTVAVLSAIARVADVSLLLLAPPEVEDEAAARAHFAAFCRKVEWPARPCSPGGGSTGGGRAPARQALRGLLPSAVRRPLAALRACALRSWSKRRELAQVRAAVASERIDVVWVAYGNINYHLAGLRRSTGVPVVIDTDSVWSRFILRELPFRQGWAAGAGILLRGWRKRLEERRGTRRADITTAVSPVDRDYYRGLAPSGERVFLMPNALDSAGYPRRAAGRRNSPPVILFSGTMSTASNEDAAIWLVKRVLPLVHAKRADVTLVIAGRDPGPSVRALAGPAVRVTGAVPDLAAELAAADIAVVPLRFESGTRFKILEAFACGVPVVSTSLGAEGLDVADDRHLLIADTPERFAAAVLRLLEDDALGRRLAGAGEALLRGRYSVEALEAHVRVVLAALGFAPGPPPGTGSVLPSAADD